MGHLGQPHLQLKQLTAGPRPTRMVSAEGALATLFLLHMFLDDERNWEQGECLPFSLDIRQDSRSAFFTARACQGGLRVNGRVRMGEKSNRSLHSLLKSSPYRSCAAGLQQRKSAGNSQGNGKKRSYRFRAHVLVRLRRGII